MAEPVFDIWDKTSFYLDRRAYYFLGGVAALFALSYFFPAFFIASQLVLLFLFAAILVDAFLMYRQKGISASRQHASRFTLNDANMVNIVVHNDYSFRVSIRLIDELPYQLQDAAREKFFPMEPESRFELSYLLTPKERGEYSFGVVNVFARGPLQLVVRRYRAAQPAVVKVYPSFRQMRRYQLLAVANNLQRSGVKRLRQIGHSMEFEQIKEYVRGEDVRTINWKATSRRGSLMVNSYTEEKSQQVYCLINKGRVMKMPYEGMTLLDHAINAALMITGVALRNGDKAGLVTFAEEPDVFIAADRKTTQVNVVMETLYRQQTRFMEPDYEKLYSLVRHRITHRSLLVLFTNFESYYSLERELPFLKTLAHYHLLLVVFFENTEIENFSAEGVRSTEDIYIKTIADKYRFEKQMIVKELQKHGILSLLTSHRDLSINLLNKYLELKNRRSI